MYTPYQIEQCLLDLALRLGRAKPHEMVHARQSEFPEWQSAGVRLISDFSREPRNSAQAHDFLVRTRHGPAVTWLFFELQDTFVGWINAGNKYGFYGSLAQTALKHLARHQPESDDPRPLLKDVLSEAFHWLHILRQTGELTEHPALIRHTQDTESRRCRTNLETGEPCA